MKSWDVDPEDLRKRAEFAGLPAWEHSMISRQKMARTVPAALSQTELSMGDSSFAFVASSIISQKYSQWQGKNLSGLLLYICGLWWWGGGRIQGDKCEMLPRASLEYIPLREHKFSPESS